MVQGNESEKMVKVQLELTADENTIVGVVKALERLKSKGSAIKWIIREHGKKVKK